MTFFSSAAKTRIMRRLGFFGNQQRFLFKLWWWISLVFAKFKLLNLRLDVLGRLVRLLLRLFRTRHSHSLRWNLVHSRRPFEDALLVFSQHHLLFLQLRLFGKARLNSTKVTRLEDLLRLHRALLELLLVEMGVQNQLVFERRRRSRSSRAHQERFRVCTKWRLFLNK